MDKELKQQVINFITSVGGNEEDIDIITEEVEKINFKTFEEIKAYIENYYL